MRSFWLVLRILLLVLGSGMVENYKDAVSALTIIIGQVQNHFREANLWYPEIRDLDNGDVAPGEHIALMSHYAMASREERMLIKTFQFMKEVWEQHRERFCLEWLKMSQEQRIDMLLALVPNVPSTSGGRYSYISGKDIADTDAIFLQEINVEDLAVDPNGLIELLDQRLTKSYIHIRKDDHNHVRQVAGVRAESSHLQKFGASHLQKFGDMRFTFLTHVLLQFLEDVFTDIKTKSKGNSTIEKENGPPSSINSLVIFFTILAIFSLSCHHRLWLVVESIYVRICDRFERVDTDGGGPHRQRNRRRARKGKKKKSTENNNNNNKSRMPPWWNKFEQYHNELEARAVDDQPLFICPIMKTIMLDPVVLSETGNTFERNAIEMWLSESNLDPQTSETLTEEPTLVPNRSLARQIRNWCEDTARTMSAEYESDSGSQVILTKSHVFVDASNILINPPRPLSDKILIDFLRACGRDVVEAHVAGSRSLQRQPWLSAKYKIHHDNRRGPERFVDDVLIAQALATAQKSFDPPRLLVLCTGDGNLNQGRTNFPVVVQTVLASRSWEVELITWRVKMNKCYYKFQKHYPDRFFIRFLEDVLDDDEPATAPR